MKPALNLHCRVQDLFKSEDQVKHAGRVTLAILDFLHDCVVVKSDTVILYNDLKLFSLRAVRTMTVPPPFPRS